MPEHLEIIDACALLNLYASGFLEPILRSRPMPCCVVEQVKRESLFIRKPSDSATSYDREPVVLEPFFQSGLLKLVKLENEAEQNLFVNLAAQIDDGEAASIAVAITHKMQVVTDDKKAIRVLKQEAPTLVHLSTLEVIKTWSEKEKIEPGVVKSALENIIKRANYFPSKKHPLFEWWRAMLNI